MDVTLGHLCVSRIERCGGGGGGQLSLRIAYLDLETSESMSKRTIADLFEETKRVLERAALAYKFEWTRGTWVFKFFDATIEDFRMRLIGVDLTGMYFTAVHFMGVYLTGVHLVAGYLIGMYLCTFWARISQACILQTCTSWVGFVI